MSHAAFQDIRHKTVISTRKAGNNIRELIEAGRERVQSGVPRRAATTAAAQLLKII